MHGHLNVRLCTYLVEIEYQIKFTNIMEIFIQDFNEIVYRFKIT